MTILTLIITFHNKTKEQLTRLFNSLSNFDNELIEIIFIYREIDVDILNWVENMPIKIVKIKSGMKNKKILYASKLAKGKYIQVVDPDDEILYEKLLLAVNKLKKRDEDVILNQYFENGKLVEWKTPKNHTVIFKKEISKKIKNVIQDRVVSQDIYFCGMIFLNSETYYNIDIPFYNYLIDRENEQHASSQGYLKSHLEVAKKEYKINMKHIERAYRKYKFKNKQSKEWAFNAAMKIFNKRLELISQIEGDFNNEGKK